MPHPPAEFVAAQSPYQHVSPPRVVHDRSPVSPQGVVPAAADRSGLGAAKEQAKAALAATAKTLPSAAKIKEPAVSGSGTKSSVNAYCAPLFTTGTGTESWDNGEGSGSEEGIMEGIMKDAEESDELEEGHVDSDDFIVESELLTCVKADMLGQPEVEVEDETVVEDAAAMRLIVEDETVEEVADERVVEEAAAIRLAVEDETAEEVADETVAEEAAAMRLIVEDETVEEVAGETVAGEAAAIRLIAEDETVEEVADETANNEDAHAKVAHVIADAMPQTGKVRVKYNHYNQRRDG